VSGDGRPDLAVTHDLPGAVSILLGNGDGTFGARIDYPAMDQPQAVAIADLNGDGVVDLALIATGATQPPGSVSVLPGIGGGAFGSTTWSAPIPDPRDIRVGDLNGDGDQDLVVDSGTQVSVFLGDGGGTYGTPADYGCAGGTLLMADFNADGRLDVASAGSGVSILLGAGDGTLGDCTPYYAGAGASTPAFADLNGDGKRDIVVANRHYADPHPDPSCPPGTVSMLAGHDDGTFGTPPSLIEPGGSPVLRDMNHDGSLDLVAGSSADAVSVWLGDGHGGFGAPTGFPVGSRPGAIAVEDLNRDGAPDVAVAHSSANAVSVLLGAGDGTLGPPGVFATGNNPADVAITDLDRDGAPDLVTANAICCVSATASVLLGYGDGTFAPRVDVEVGYSHGYPVSVAAGDLNGDANPDLAFALFGVYDAPYWGSLAVLRGNGDGTFAYPPAFPGVLNPTFVAIGDVNLDGRPDLAATSAGFVTEVGWEGPGFVSVFRGNADGTFTATGGSPVGESPASLVIEDFDGDDKPDLAVAGGRSPQVTVLPGRGDGTFDARTDYGVVGAVASMVSGDLDGDHRPDLVLATVPGMMLLRNVTPDWPTAALLSLFHGVWSDRGVELRWRFGEPGRFASAVVERGERADGPWHAVEGERREEGGVSVLLDRGVEAGRTYFYRLLATAAGGEPTIFGPLEVKATAWEGEFALLPVAPNPGHDRVRIGFAVAYATRVRIDVLDVRGRHVTQLADGVRMPGRHELVWDGRAEGGRAPAGLYFVRCDAAGVRRVGRFVIIR
jgi:hypothetical protein